MALIRFLLLITCVVLLSGRALAAVGAVAPCPGAPMPALVDGGNTSDNMDMGSTLADVSSPEQDPDDEGADADLGDDAVLPSGDRHELADVAFMIRHRFEAGLDPARGCLRSHFRPPRSSR